MRDLRDAASNGSRADVLEALRDRIAAEIEAGVPARDLAALSRQLVQITAELEDLKGPTERSAADELARRRASRRADAPTGDAAAR